MEETIWEIRLREESEREGERQRKLKEALDRCAEEISTLFRCGSVERFAYIFPEMTILYAIDGLNPGLVTRPRHPEDKLMFVGGKRHVCGH